MKKNNFSLDFLKLRSASGHDVGSRSAPLPPPPTDSCPSPRSDSSRDTDRSSLEPSSPRRHNGLPRRESREPPLPSPRRGEDMQVVTKQVCRMEQRDLLAEGIKGCNFCPYCKDMGVLCAVGVHRGKLG
jgi:hypothetical protein